MTKNCIDTTIPVECTRGGTGRTSWAGSTSGGILKYDGTQLATSSLVTIDADNVIINAQQPAFYAYKSSSTSNVTGDGTVYNIIFDAEAYDRSSSYDNTTGIFTAPVSGTYSFTANVMSDGTSHSRSTMNLLFKYNGSTVAQQDFYFNNTTLTFAAWRTLVYTMSAGDTMRMSFAISGTGKSSNIFGAIAIQEFTYFCGHLIC